MVVSGEPLSVPEPHGFASCPVDKEETRAVARTAKRYLKIRLDPRWAA
jgi:hypothetical protein